MKKASCTWYVEPIGGLTNENVAEALGSDASANEQAGMKCSDGKCRDLWEVPWSLIEKLVVSRRVHLFQIFRSKNNRPPAKVTRTVDKFFEPKVSKKGKITTAAKLLKQRRP